MRIEVNVNENQQPNIQQKHMFSKLSTYTHKLFRSTSMQEAYTSWVKAFDDYMCTSVNVKKCISYIVNENNKICYTVQYIKVHFLYIFTMLCMIYVFTA